MAERKKACVFHVLEDNCDVAKVVKRLEGEGFDVHVVAVSKAEAVAIDQGQTGDTSAEAAACIENADLIMVLISKSVETSAPIVAILTEAQNEHGRIVGVWGGGGVGSHPRQLSTTEILSSTPTVRPSTSSLAVGPHLGGAEGRPECSPRRRNTKSANDPTPDFLVQGGERLRLRSQPILRCLHASCCKPEIRDRPSPGP